MSVPMRSLDEPYDEGLIHAVDSVEDTDLHDAPQAPPELAALDDDLDREPTSTLALFEGDEGSLEVAQRRALVVLIKQRFMSNRTHPKEWAALIANPRPIRARLNDLFLELVLDAEREVAYKRQVSPEGGGRPFPTLLYDAPWGREETLALVYLRTRHRSEQAAGADRAFVDRADIEEFIAQHRPAHATDISGDARKARNAIDSIFKTGLLIGPSTGERFEISDAIEVLLPLEKLTELLAWIRARNETGEDSTEPTQMAMSTPEPVGGTGRKHDRDDEEGSS
jgi:hypothetical protein